MRSLASRSTSSAANGRDTKARWDDDEEDSDDLERYLGQTVSVTGALQRVFEPRLFPLDEVNRVDLDGETLIYVPAPLAAFLSDDQPATVTGVVRHLADEGTVMQMPSGIRAGDDRSGEQIYAFARSVTK